MDFQSHGDYDAALAKYKVAAQNCMDSPELWNNIGLCFYSKEKIVTVGLIKYLQFTYTCHDMCHFYVLPHLGIK